MAYTKARQFTRDFVSPYSEELGNYYEARESARHEVREALDRANGCGFTIPPTWPTLQAIPELRQLSIGGQLQDCATGWPRADIDRAIEGIEHELSRQRAGDHAPAETPKDHRSRVTVGNFALTIDGRHVPIGRNYAWTAFESLWKNQSGSVELDKERIRELRQKLRAADAGWLAKAIKSARAGEYYLDLPD